MIKVIVKRHKAEITLNEENERQVTLIDNGEIVTNPDFLDTETFEEDNLIKAIEYIGEENKKTLSVWAKSETVGTQFEVNQKYISSDSNALN